MSEDDTPDEPATRDVPLDSDELIARYGNQERVIQKLITKVDNLEEDNKSLRDDRRDLRKKVPGEDEIVLGPDEQEQLQEVGALSEDGTVKADDLQERLSEAEEAQKELQTLRRKEQRREVYEATGLNAQAAEDILPNDLDYETETVDGEDGEETKAFVVTDDGRTPVEDYIEESYSEPIQNALYAESGEGDDDSGGTKVPTQTPAGEDKPGPDEPDEEEIRRQQDEDVGYTL